VGAFQGAEEVKKGVARERYEEFAMGIIIGGAIGDLRWEEGGREKRRRLCFHR
jgi:hypothetical protein